MLPAALQYAAPASPRAGPGGARGVAGGGGAAGGAGVPWWAARTTRPSSDRRLKICGVLCDDITVAPVATATSNLKHLRELV